MGGCVSTAGQAHDSRKAQRQADKRAREASQNVAQAEQTLELLTHDVKPELDGSQGHLRVKPTLSGRMLLGPSDKPMSAAEVSELRTILEENPGVASQFKDLSVTGEMGLGIRATAAPAFIGLIIADVLSVTSEDFRNPQVQMVCENDKSVFFVHHGSSEAASPTASSDYQSASLPRDSTGSRAPQKSLSQSSVSKVAAERTFVWERTSIVFVALYSLSRVQVRVRDRGLAVPGKANVQGEAVFKVSDLRQGEQPLSLRLHSKDGEVGTVELRVRYKWLRGTHDTGRRTHTDMLTIDRRKLKDFRSVVSHISNVNHWLLSHDNVWTALPPLHHKIKDHRLSQKSSLQERESDSEQQESSDGATSSDWYSRGGSGRCWEKLLKQDMNTNFEQSAEDCKSAMTKLFDLSLEEALIRDTDDEEHSPEMDSLKGKVANMFMLVNDRMSALEDTVSKQHEIIMELQYKLDTQGNDQAKMPYISGRFGYGLGRAASKRDVLLFARQSQATHEKSEYPVVFLGKHKTNYQGQLGPVEVPHTLVTTPGHYDIVALLPEDNTFARGSLYILAPGTKCVLFDMDGTITVGDQEVVAQFALNAVAASTAVGDRVLTQAYDQKARAHSRTLVRLWAAKGYQPVYLSGRQGSFYNLTLQWLIKHDYPPGPIHLTRTHMPTLPMYFSVGNFKVKYMEGLKRKGFELYAAYGNTGTDVRAYAAAGVPVSRTYTVGQAAGNGGTTKVSNWSTHLLDVLNHPDSDVPIPYVDLLWVSMPKRAKAKKTASGVSYMTKTDDVETCGTLEMDSMTPSEAATDDVITSEDLDAAQLNATDVFDEEDGDDQRNGTNGNNSTQKMRSGISSGQGSLRPVDTMASRQL